MKLAVLAVGAALAGCTDSPDPTWDPLLGLPTTSIFDLQLDPTGHVIASSRTSLWRYSDSRKDWGQVGYNGRATQFIVGPFVIDSDGVVYATETLLSSETSVYRLPVEGGVWEAFDEGLPPRTKFQGIVADRTGMIYAPSPGGIYRLTRGATSWQLFSSDAVGQCFNHVDTDNTIYLSCGDMVHVIRPGASALETLPGVRRVHSINRDRSLNVSMQDGSNGRLATGSSTPVPYPAFPLAVGIEVVHVPYDDSLGAPVPVPFGVDADDNVYAIGKDRYAALVDVFKLERGGDTWVPLGSNAASLVRRFLVSPEGDLYHYSFQIDSTKTEAVYRRRAP